MILQSIKFLKVRDPHVCANTQHSYALVSQCCKVFKRILNHGGKGNYYVENVFPKNI